MQARILDALESPERDQIDRYITSSVKNSFLKMAHSVEFKVDTSHEHVLASLAEETKKLLKKDTTIFTPVLSKWHPQGTVVYASLIHKLYGNKLLITLVREFTLTQLMSVMASVARDDGLHSICRKKIAPYQIESKSGTLVFAG